MLSKEKEVAVEKQIGDLKRLVDYVTLEYPAEILVAKYLEGGDDDENEIFVPQYQRDFVWSDERQSKFIESLFLGLPIPLLFVADIAEDSEGRLEIVDGSQRIRTLANYIEDGLTLCELKKLTELNGTQFSDLPRSRQRRFNRTNIRLVQLTDKADSETRRDIFERINTGSDQLRPADVRRGLQGGKFADFVERCAHHSTFEELAPVTDRLKKRKEREELALRFFAYLDKHEEFDHRVDEFLSKYQGNMNASEFDADIYMRKFTEMLEFIQRTLPYGFKKSENAKSTPRVRFETLAVGAALALQEKPDLVCNDVDWLDSDEFKEHTRSDGSNSKVKLARRLAYARDKFLAGH